MLLNILLAYLLFCLSVGITSWFTVYKPILNDLKEIDLDVWEVHYGKTTWFITTFTTALLAPLLLHMVLVGPDEDFAKNYINGLLEETEK